MLSNTDISVIFVLKITLIVALICSVYIYINVFVFKHKHYSKQFDAWQFPMILALLSDLYLIK